MKAKAKFKRPSINGRLVVLLSAFIILILMLASPIRDLVAQRARIAALEIQVQQSQKQVELLREIQAKWNDPNFKIRWPTKNPILSKRDMHSKFIE